MQSQPEVELDAGVYWWIDEDHLIKTVKFWKMKDHPCFRGIRLPAISDDWESRCGWSESQRSENKEKVIKSWKHLSTKPYSLLEKYHKDYLEEHRDEWE